MTGTVLNAMPPDSTVYVYGALSQEPCGNIDPIELVFHNKSLTGFYLGNWLDAAARLAFSVPPAACSDCLSTAALKPRFSAGSSSMKSSTACSNTSAT